LESPQRSAELRIQVNRDFIPASVPEPTLQITIDNDLFDLTGKNFKHWIEYPLGCNPGDCGAYAAVLVDLPTEMLNRFVLATKVKGTLSDIPFELTTEHGHRIGAFIQRLAGK
jgi:hypothetical protein